MDGGLPTVISRGPHLTTTGVCGPCRWMAPEALDPQDVLDGEVPGSFFTKASDVYSLGMTILEVYTGKVPFCHRRYDTVVILDVIRGIKPQQPATSVMSEGIWKVLQSCWQFDSECRPPAIVVEAWLTVIFYAERFQKSLSEVTIC